MTGKYYFICGSFTNPTDEPTVYERELNAPVDYLRAKSEIEAQSGKRVVLVVSESLSVPGMLAAAFGAGVKLDKRARLMTRLRQAGNQKLPVSSNTAPGPIPEIPDNHLWDQHGV